MTSVSTNKAKSSLSKHLAGSLFEVNDYVVYPGHGVAQISRMVQKNVGKEQLNFLELKIIQKGVTALVPADNFAAVGIRPVSSKAVVTKMFTLLAQPGKPVLVVGASWGRRNREFTSKIARGDLLELAEIYRDLRNVSRYKELSFGEKAFTLQIEALLIEEVAIVERCTPADAMILLRKELIK